MWEAGRWCQWWVKRLWLREGPQSTGAEEREADGMGGCWECQLGGVAFTCETLNIDISTSAHPAHGTNWTRGATQQHPRVRARQQGATKGDGCGERKG